MYSVCRSARIFLFFSVIFSAPVFAATPQATPVSLAQADSAALALRAQLTVSDLTIRQVESVYAGRGDAPIWVDDGLARAETLIAALRDAEAHALPVARYAPDALEAALSRRDPTGLAAVDLALTRAFLRYARDVSSGLLEPGDVSRDIHVKVTRPDPVALLRVAAAAPDLGAFLASLAPADPEYTALKARYAALSLRAANGDWGPAVEPGPTLRAGDRDPRVEALRARLTAMGDLTGPTTTADPRVYDPRLEAAVLGFQRRHGLNEDGAVGAMTLAALNVPARARAAQVAVNLERMRWLNHDLGARRIVVNQPAFTVTLIDHGAVLFHERVVVGTQKNQTPEFSDEMEMIVLNPSWHVPRSIATKELLPLLKNDPGYLSRNSMTLTRPDGGLVPADPSTHDFSAYTTRDFPYRIRQTPNPDNALGEVKFLFPNDYAIYLHDTPSKRLFDRDQRAFSHGCVRVRDPLELATLLLAPQKADPRGFIDAVIASGNERYVRFDTPVPVHLTYRTAWVEDKGGDAFRADIYGRDEAVLEALRAAGVEAPEV
jgi:murein L,D-transpeptidase YcbB/YkuD